MGALAAIISSSSWSTTRKADEPSCDLTRLYPKSSHFTGRQTCRQAKMISTHLKQANQCAYRSSIY